MSYVDYFTHADSDTCKCCFFENALKEIVYVNLHDTKNNLDTVVWGIWYLMSCLLSVCVCVCVCCVMVKKHKEGK